MKSANKNDKTLFLIPQLLFDRNSHPEVQLSDHHAEVYLNADINNEQMCGFNLGLALPGAVQTAQSNSMCISDKQKTVFYTWDMLIVLGNDLLSI